MANLTKTTSAVFIPAIWLNEIRAYVESKLVAAKLVKRINFVGKSGDTLHIPDTTALTTGDKAASTDVTFEAPTEGEFTMSINKHKYSAFKLEDIVATQAAYDLRSEYTKSAGYAIAKRIDTDILSKATSFSRRRVPHATDDLAAWDPTASTNTGNGDNLDDAAILGAIELLDVQDVPDDDRAFVIHPAQKRILLGISRFTEYQMIGPGGMPIRSGVFGEVYGIPVYVSTNVPVITATNGTTQYHENVLIHRDAWILATQKEPRIQAEYVVRSLAWEVVVDTIYGVAEYRDLFGVSLISPV